MDAPQEMLASVLGQLRWIGWAQAQAANAWVADRGLSQQQGFALGYLAENPGAIQRDIAEMTRTSAASVSSLLQGLERRALIERRTEHGDERSKRVFATPEGVALVSGFDTAMLAVEDSILAPLEPHEREVLRSLLAKVTAELPTPSR